MTRHPTVPYGLPRYPETELRARARSVFAEMDSRRSVRDFSSGPVPRDVVESAIRAASTAPSGAHRQPWRFVLVGDPEVKRRIRVAAEVEERENYTGGRLPPEWREALAPLATDWKKPYLESAPWIVVVFEERYGVNEDGSRRHNYYVKESVGIACGLFIAALHQLGLATLTHTPSPMAFLAGLLGRPANERPFILFPIGYPATGCRVPALVRKPLDEIMIEVRAADLSDQEDQAGTGDPGQDGDDRP
jgi:nitroreductase